MDRLGGLALSGTGFAGEKNRDVTRRGLLQQCECGAERYRRAHQTAEARHGCNRDLVLLRERLEGEAREPELKDGTLGKFGFTYPRSVDTRAVSAAEIPDPWSATRLDEDLAVKTRDGAVLDMD